MDTISKIISMLLILISINIQAQEDESFEKKSLYIKHADTVIVVNGDYIEDGETEKESISISNNISTQKQLEIVKDKIIEEDNKILILNKIKDSLLTQIIIEDLRQDEVLLLKKRAEENCEYKIIGQYDNYNITIRDKKYKVLKKLTIANNDIFDCPTDKEYQIFVTANGVMLDTLIK